MKTLVTLVLIYMLFSEALQASAALRCYQCTGLTCVPKPVTCTPPEDHCQTTTIAGNGTVKGCAPKTACDQGSASEFMKCCGTDLCNSAEGVKLSLLIIMLVPLISSILFI